MLVLTFHEYIIIQSWIFKCVAVAVAAARGTATNLIAIFKSNRLRVATALNHNHFLNFQ